MNNGTPTSRYKAGSVRNSAGAARRPARRPALELIAPCVVSCAAGIVTPAGQAGLGWVESSRVGRSGLRSARRRSRPRVRRD